MQSITVKYFPATDHKPERLQCKSQAPTKYYSYHATYTDGDFDQRCCEVASDYAKSLGWSGEFVSGVLPSGDVVFVNKASKGFSVESVNMS